MALPTGTRLGPYEVLTLVGVGGMGEVYRARDSRLGRTVAIKVIGSSFTDHEEMRRRFEEEGRFVAQLDHPRIGAIYDVGHDAGVDFLVMEFLEGKSLAMRIAEGPVPIPELIGYAIEIAAALAYAHHRGVVHRDLKPGNILLTRTGIKIIDFGLGKLRQDKQRPSADLAALKTLPMTEPGVVPGTAQYMPPERLEGMEADHRSDIFAFGAILYEMATARRPFEASTPAALIAAILTSEPRPMFDRRGENDDLEWVVQRCLKKDPDERWQSMADVENVLKRIASTSSRARAPQPHSSVRPWMGAIVAGTIALLAMAALLVAARLSRGDAAAAHPIALTIPPPEGGGFTPTESSLQSAQLAVSPDGRSLAFVASGSDGASSLWVRPVDATAAKMIPDTARATYPFWSPSSRSLGFFADGHLKRIDLDGGPSRTLAAAPNGRGGTWNANDVILFCPGTSSPIHRVSANGAAVAQTTLSITRHEMSHRWPQFLPDGRHFIYLSRSQDETSSGIFLASLDTSEVTFVVATGFGARYSPTGHLLYVADEALMMAPFDVAHGRLSGEARPILDEIATASSFYSAFSVSRDVLAFAPRAGVAKLAWVGRDGRQLGPGVPPGNYVDFQISRDGRHVAVAQIDPHVDFSNVRVIDLKRGTNQLVTTSPATDASPVWSPDGTRIVFRSNREVEHDLYMQSASGGDDAPFLKTPTAKYPTQWSPDGKFIVYHTFDDQTRFDIWAAPVDDSAGSRPLVRTKADETQGQISPNNKWLAYTSNISSRREVYVQPMADDGRKWPMSVDGGSNPKWSADGRELFYLAPDNRLMSVDVGAGDGLDPGTPRALFSLSDVTITRPFLSRWYDVDSTGHRFLVRVPVGIVQTLPLNMYVHWSSLPRISH